MSFVDAIIVRCEFPINSVVYCPIKDNLVTTSICAIGREGVWRLINADFHCPHNEVQANMRADLPTFRPEAFGFVLMGLNVGMS